MKGEAGWGAFHLQPAVKGRPSRLPIKLMKFVALAPFRFLPFFRRLVLRRLIPLKAMLQSEDGSFTSTALLLSFVISIMAIAVIDGSSVFYTYRAANEGSDEAARVASEEYKLYRDGVRAEQAAVDRCERKGLVFVEVYKEPLLGSGAYSVTCEKDANTYVFKRLPYLKNLIHQRVTSTSYNSI